MRGATDRAKLNILTSNQEILEGASFT